MATEKQEWTFESIWPESVPYLDPTEELPAPGKRSDADPPSYWRWYKVMDTLSECFEHPIANHLARLTFIDFYYRTSRQDSFAAYNEAMESLGYTEWMEE